MSLSQLLVLAVIQGITEFIPVSSSGHLNLISHLFSVSPSLSFDIFLNSATLLSVIVFFWTQKLQFIKSLKYILIASVPAAIAGILLKSFFESIYSNISLLPLFFLLTSILLFATRTPKKKSKLNTKNALIIGLAQSFAILPGVSRSGATIAAGLLLGLAPSQAFNFSFFLFIPASLGALLLDFKNITTLSLSPSLLISFLLTFFIGILAIKSLQKFINAKKIWYFSIYTFILSTCLFLFL